MVVAVILIGIVFAEKIEAMIPEFLQNMGLYSMQVAYPVFMVLFGIAALCFFVAFKKKKDYKVRLGTTPAGFHLVPYKLNGINTKMLEATEEQKQLILLIFQMYAKPECSYGDIVDCFDDNGYLLDGERLKRSTVKRILTNPSYVVADADIYEFYRNQGTEIVNDPVDFNGVGSCYLHKKRGAKNTDTTLNNFRLVLAPHSGIIPSDLWLVCAKKVLSNRTYQSARNVERTWLSGKVRCGHCKRALVATQNGKGYSYFRCTLRKDNKNACEGAGKLKVPDFECLIEGALKERMKSFQALQ